MRLFKTVPEAHQYLVDAGWRVSQSNLYRHVQESKIKPTRTGRWSTTRLDRYARAHLVPLDRPVGKEQEHIQIRRLRAEIDLKTEQLRTMQERRARLESRYVPRSEVNKAHGARAMVVYSQLRRVLEKRLPEVVETARGDRRKVPAAKRIIHAVLDAAMPDFTRQPLMEV